MAEEGEIALDDSEEEVEEEEEEEEEESGKKEPEITPAKARMNRLFELRMKLNKARSLNKTAVLDEFKRGDDGNQVDWKAKKVWPLLSSCGPWVKVALWFEPLH